MSKEVLKTIYSFEEVKEKAIEQNRYINVEHEWYDGTIEDWENRLSEIGFCNAKIYFSGFACQGDGACFDCESYNFDLQEILNNLDFSKEEKEKIYNLSPLFNLSIEKHDGRYCHEMTRYVDVYYFGDEKYTELMTSFERKLEDLRIKLCREIYDNLRDEFYSLIEDDCVAETLSDYWFNEDGTIYESK